MKKGTKTLVTILGGVLIAMSLLLCVAQPVGGIIGILIGVAVIFLARRQKEPAAAPDIQPQPTKNGKTYFTAVGMKYHEDLFEMLSEKDSYKKPYDRDFRFYQYETFEAPCELVREPENEHDANAVKVMVCGKLVAYIASEEAVAAHPFCGSGLPMRFKLSGGPYKVFDGSKGKWRRENASFSGVVEVDHA